ncbi:MAG: nucleotide sugar dehydrogenase [Candidatus Omnitrophica bacterium]|nr:nucleotide sugar dehydrogenase [Candidatus Omnitrophota bacterium]
MNNFLEEFKRRVSQHQIKIAVIGLGYVGLPLAIEFAKKGFLVFGIDLDKDRVKGLKRKISYITDVSNADLRKVIEKNKFLVGTNFSVLDQIDVVFICVPTPLKRKYYPDISFIKEAIKNISGNIKEHTLIILESTTYPGTTEEVILPMLKKKGLKDFYLCFSPERIDPGNKRFTLTNIPKIVAGIDEFSVSLATLVYKTIIDKVIPVSSCRVAEMVKLLENTFRLVNIAMIDELAMMAKKMNIDIWEVIGAAKTKPFGFMPFYPGPGVGGHCIPKDPLYLYWKAKKLGFNSCFIRLASRIINRMPKYIVERLDEILKEKDLSLDKAKILIMGVTYKKDIKDLRKSPVLDIIEILKNKGASVFYHDPLIPYLKFNHINLRSIDLKKTNLAKFDCTVITTDHTNIDYDFLLKNSSLIFDTRNVYKDIKTDKVIRL